MEILSVNVGAPADDYSAWVRKIKIAHLMKSLGHQVDFIIYSWEKDINEEILTNIPGPCQVVRVSRLNFFFKHLEILGRKNYDVVFCNGQFSHALLFLTKLKNVVLIMDKHGDMVEEFLLLKDGFQYRPRFMVWYLYLKVIDTLNFYFADRITCVSHKMIESLCKRGFKSKNLFYVTNGIEDHFFDTPDKQTIQKLKEKLGIKDQMVFTYLGAFEKWQGVDEFIKAAESLKNDAEIVFVIVGGEKEVKEGNIHLIPKVPQEIVSQYYALSDVLVLPRPSHPATEVAAPTKFPEYLAMGKPILTTNVGDAACFVEKNHCGIVVRNNNPECLKEGIIQFKNKNKDDMRFMGVNSRKLAEKEFSIDKMDGDLSIALDNIN